MDGCPVSRCGTNVRITVPAGRRHSSKKRPRTIGKSADLTASLNFAWRSGDNGGVQILLVEDDAAIASSLGESLTAAGFDVDHVATGTEAIHAPLGDVVLLDLGLPDMDGYDVCRAIRAASDVPIIVITAPRRGTRPCPRARTRRRRLRRQAVRVPRAGCAHPRRDPARPRRHAKGATAATSATTTS